MGFAISLNLTYILPKKRQKNNKKSLLFVYKKLVPQNARLV